uniref:Deoxyribonuclease TATDN1 n=1 Tax=Romanomermis culicivorax TaxID=13658 RepID=A0A915I2C4_ROMCU
MDRAAPYSLIDIGANLNSHHFKNEELDDVVSRAKAAECVSLGECGLDFNRNFSPPADQLKAFEAQVDLACELQKPLFVHEREAHEDLVKILTKRRQNPLPPVVVHCFTGTWDEAKSYLDFGFYIGLTGFLWKDKLENGVKYMLKNQLLPLDRLLIETDAPYMFPNVKAKKLRNELKSLESNSTSTAISDHAEHFLNNFCNFDRNEPCSLAATCELIAAFWNRTPEEVARRTTENARKFYGFC